MPLYSYFNKLKYHQMALFYTDVSPEFPQNKRPYRLWYGLFFIRIQTLLILLTLNRTAYLLLVSMNRHKS